MFGEGQVENMAKTWKCPISLGLGKYFSVLFVNA